MGRETDIGWTDSTINPTSGCDGCELYRPDADGIDEDATCYAHGLHLKRLSKALPDLYAPRFDEVRLIPGRMRKAASWSDLAGCDRPNKPWLDHKRRHIFVGDMSDILSDAVTDDFLERELLAAIKSPQGQRHTWQILTKRPRRLAKLSKKWGGLPPNVIAMTTVTNQATANARVRALLEVECHWRAISCEPMLAAVNFWRWLRPEFDVTDDLLDAPDGAEMDGLRRVGMRWARVAQIHQIIVGGESGDRARPMHPANVEAILDQCQASNTRFFFKQWGAWRPWEPGMQGLTRFVDIDGSLGEVDGPEGVVVRAGRPVFSASAKRMVRVGKDAGLPTIRGCTWTGMAA